MDRSRKRKAAPGASPESEGSAAKRAKIPQQDSESTKRVGLQFIEQIKNAKDKTGRIISDLFLELPDPDSLPDYYDQIKLPIAIETIEERLRQDEYASLTQVESDLKRMVSNAKQYNDPTSIVYADAERIRKMVSNFMTKNNPAYKDPDYVAFPTPIPDEEISNGTRPQATPRPAVRPTPSKQSVREASEPRKPTVTLSLKNRKASVAADSPTATEPTYESPAPSGDFTGKTFQQAQEQIVNEMMTYTEESDDLVYGPFINLPSRSLTEYYKVIKKPVSLSAIKKKVKGKHGREDPTGISDFKTWDTFEDEVSNIWNNAKTFNEDGSEIFNLAEDFEQHFKERLALAKQQVGSPQQPKITLKSRPKPVLHLGAKGSPAPASTTGVTIDNDALARQKQAVATGINGHQTPVPKRPSLPPSRSASQVPAVTPMKRTQSGQAATPPVAAAAVIKAEKSAVPSPSISSARLQSAVPEVRPPSASMLPPAPRIASASPHPAATPAPIQPPPVPAYVPAPVTFVDQYSRKTPLADALLPNLTLLNHPQLQVPKPFRMDIPPSRTFTHHSLTINLPHTHYALQIVPTLSARILASRQYKIFVTVNGARLMASTRPFINGEANGTAGAPKQVYDASLAQGVNRIEVEIVAIAGGARGASGALDTEKLSIFANLLRS